MASISVTAPCSAHRPDRGPPRPSPSTSRSNDSRRSALPASPIRGPDCSRNRRDSSSVAPPTHWCRWSPANCRGSREQSSVAPRHHCRSRWRPRRRYPASSAPSASTVGATWTAESVRWRASTSPHPLTGQSGPEPYSGPQPANPDRLPEHSHHP